MKYIVLLAIFLLLAHYVASLIAYIGTYLYEYWRSKRSH